MRQKCSTSLLCKVIWLYISIVYTFQCSCIIDKYIEYSCSEICLHCITFTKIHEMKWGSQYNSTSLKNRVWVQFFKLFHRSMGTVSFSCSISKTFSKNGKNLPIKYFNSVGRILRTWLTLCLVCLYLLSLQHLAFFMSTQVASHVYCVSFSHFKWSSQKKK